MIERIERITIMDKEQKKGVDAVFLMENNRVVRKHIEEITSDDWGE